MDEVTEKFSVFFEAPFWVGVFERITNGGISACKVTFGAEPKDYEVEDFILKRYYTLKFSPPVEAVVKKKAKNPKRIQREVKKQMCLKGIGTKSQQILKLQHEEYKREQKKYTKEQKELELQRHFELRQQKRKEKHRGR